MPRPADLARRALCAFLLLATAPPACAPDPAAPRTGRIAASLAFDPAGLLWVASPDDGVVVALDPVTLEVQAEHPVPGEPGRILAVDGQLLVVGARSAALTLAGDGAIPLPCGGATGLAALDGRIFVACPFDDRVVEVDLAARLVTRALHAPARPTAVAIVADRLVVTASSAGVIRSVALADLPAPAPTLAAVRWRDDPLPTRDGLAPVQLDALAVDGGRLVGAYQIVQHDGDRDRAPEDGGYGEVVAGNPRIEPRVLADCGSAYARFDGGARAMSGPSAVALDAARERLWVVNRGTGQVAVFGCEAGARPADLLPLIALFPIGDGARGIVLDPAGIAFVDVAFDHAVARLEVGGDPFVRRRETGPRALSRAAEQGRRHFFDARNVHLTPSGVVTCATCHPDGGDDGLAWFLHTPNVPRKLRRTPPAWAVRPEVRPLHWDGEFTAAEALVTTTLTELLQGDGLLVDPAAIAAWMRERPPPIPRPLSPAEAAAAREGEAVFAAAGCAECHPAPDYTDGQAHAVLEPSPDPDGRLDAAITPSLIATRARAPYLHDGRAASLDEVLDLHAPPLSAETRAALRAFLEAL